MSKKMTIITKDLSSLQQALEDQIRREYEESLYQAETEESEDDSLLDTIPEELPSHLKCDVIKSLTAVMRIDAERISIGFAKAVAENQKVNNEKSIRPALDRIYQVYYNNYMRFRQIGLCGHISADGLDCFDVLHNTYFQLYKYGFIVGKEGSYRARRNELVNYIQEKVYAGYKYITYDKLVEETRMAIPKQYCGRLMKKMRLSKEGHSRWKIPSYWSKKYVKGLMRLEKQPYRR